MEYLKKMENETAIVGIPRRLWKVVRVLTKGIFKKKLLLLLQRGKLLGHVLPASLHVNRRAHHSIRKQPRYDSIDDEEEEAAAAAIQSVLQEMMALNDAVETAASPVLPGFGFGRSPVVRQLRVTDSPFPVFSGRDEGDCHVDEAAEEFIRRFYCQLRKQSLADHY